VQEGVAFALGYGFELLQQLGIRPRTIRAGRTNMFQSEVFCATFAQVTGAELELFNTDGAQGAARGAGLGVGHYASEAEAFDSIERVGNYSPNHPSGPEVKAAFERWKRILKMKSEQS
jgi:xylulokinase